MKENGIPAEIVARIKRPYSIWSKMKRRDIGFDQVYDFLALRIITDSVKSCYAALGIIHQKWPPIPQRFRDFIAMPKPNLYQALHTTVITEGQKTFEIQIRTREMHDLAENGIAAHWKYKDEARQGLMGRTGACNGCGKWWSFLRSRRIPRNSSSTSRSTSSPRRSTSSRPREKSSTCPREPRPSTSPSGSTRRSVSTAPGPGSTASLSAQTVLKTGDIVEILTAADKGSRRGAAGHGGHHRGPARSSAGRSISRA